MAIFTYQTADAAHGAFACRLNKFQADDDLMLNGITTAKVGETDLPSFADWDILVVIQEPRDALIVRSGALISVNSINPTTQEEKLAARNARYKLAELAKVDRRQTILQTVASHVGTRATIVDGRLLIDGQAVWDLSIHEDQDRSRGYASGTNGKVSVTVGDYGDKSRYPQRKDGTHNYPEIATKLVRCHDVRTASTLASRKRHSNQSHVKTLRDQFGYGSGWNFEAVADDAKPVRAERKLAFFGTSEEIQAYIAAIDEVTAKFKR